MYDGGVNGDRLPAEAVSAAVPTPDERRRRVLTVAAHGPDEGGSGVVWVARVAGCRPAGCVYERSLPACGACAIAEQEV